MNFYRVGQRAVARSVPSAFIIPARQRDPGATRRLLETLSYGLVEIEKAPNGDHVVRMQQPYSSFAKALLERQAYPDLRMYPDGPPKRRYDVTAHTLPLLFGVEVKAVDAPVSGVLTKERFPLHAAASTSYSAADTDSWKTINALWKAGKSVWREQTTGDFSDSDKQSGWKKLNAPRIALYKSFVPSMG